MLTRAEIFPEATLPEAAAAIAEGRSLAGDWRLTPGAYLKDRGAVSEAEIKRALAAEGRVALHAQIGFRNLERSRRAWGEIAAATAVERYGVCLD